MPECNDCGADVSECDYYDDGCEKGYCRDCCVCPQCGDYLKISSTGRYCEGRGCDFDEDEQ